jgi:hypothetical protein
MNDKVKIQKHLGKCQLCIDQSLELPLKKNRSIINALKKWKKNGNIL